MECRPTANLTVAWVDTHWKAVFSMDAVTMGLSQPNDEAAIQCWLSSGIGNTVDIAVRYLGPMKDDTSTLTSPEEGALASRVSIAAREQLQSEGVIVTEDITVNGNENITIVLPSEFLAWTLEEEDTRWGTTTYSVEAFVGEYAALLSKPFIEHGTLKATLQVPAFTAVCGSHEGCNTPDLARHRLRLRFTQYIQETGNEPVILSKMARCPGTEDVCARGLPTALYYVSECLGYETGDTCLYRNSTTYNCAYGSGEACQPCPEGAICPGGFRAWPMLGYWTGSEDNKAVTQCPPPATVRCLGWNRGFQEVECGPGYQAGSPLCQSCERGYFTRDGACIPCPTDTSGAFELQVLPIICAISGGILLYVVVYIILRRTFKRHKIKVSTTRALKMPLDYVMWTLVALQLLAQVGRSPMPGLPPVLRQIFNVVQLVQLDVGGISPPECTEGSPFDRLQIIFIVVLSSLGLWLAFIGMRALVARLSKCSKGVGKMLSFARYGCLVVLLLGYPLAVNSSALLLSCNEIPAGGDETLLVWSENTYYTCWEGEHASTVFLGMITLFCIGVLLPAMLLLAARRIVTRVTTVQGLTSGKTPPPPRDGLKQCNTCPPWCCVERDIHTVLRRRRAWTPLFGFGQPWFRPSHLLFFLWLAVLQWIPAHSFEMKVVTFSGKALSLFAFGLAVFMLRPDHEWGVWRRWPRMFVAATSCLVALLELSLIIDEHRRVEGNDSVGGAGTEASPLTLSIVSLILVWTLLAAICMLPVLQFVFFAHWLATLTGTKLLCWRCGNNNLLKQGGAHAGPSRLSEFATGASSPSPSMLQTTHSPLFTQTKALLSQGISTSSFLARNMGAMKSQIALHDFKNAPPGVSAFHCDNPVFSRRRKGIMEPSRRSPDQDGSEGPVPSTRKAASVSALQPGDSSPTINPLMNVLRRNSHVKAEGRALPWSGATINPLTAVGDNAPLSVHTNPMMERKAMMQSQPPLGADSGMVGMLQRHMDGADGSYRLSSKPGQFPIGTEDATTDMGAMRQSPLASLFMREQRKRVAVQSLDVNQYARSLMGVRAAKSTYIRAYANAMAKTVAKSKKIVAVKSVKRNSRSTG